MTRALTALATLAAVVAAVGSGINWIKRQCRRSDRLACGIDDLFGPRRGLDALFRKRADSRYEAYAFATLFGGFLNMFVLDDALPDDVNGCIFAAVALVPAALELYRGDRTSRKTCLDCREDIRRACQRL